MNNDIAKKMPFSMIAEQALLGSVLIDPESIRNIADTVSDSDFYVTEHQQIFAAMLRLFSTSSQIDVITLIDDLVRDGVYDKSGGENYIRMLIDSVPSALNIRDYAKIVKEKSLLRRLVEAGEDIAERAYSEQDSVGDLLDYAGNKIYSIAQGRDDRNFITIDKVLMQVYEHLHQLQTDPEASQGTKTGFSDLDNVLAGMGNSDLILVGGGPGMGKTSFAMNIATNVALKTHKKVAIFSLEMSAEQLATRMLASEALVSSYALRTGNISDDDWTRLAGAVDRLSGSRILIDDTPGISVTGTKAKLRREGDIGLVIIDYLQLMQGEKHTDNRVQEVADITRGMKLMAKELNVPIICCAQLSRGPEGRQDKKPMLSDLRDSGSIEQDADTVLFVYRDEYYKTSEDAGPDKNSIDIVECIVAKNRHGSTGSVKLSWSGTYTLFRSIENNAPEPPTGY